MGLPISTFKKFKMDKLTTNDIIDILATGIILSLIAVQIAS